MGNPAPVAPCSDPITYSETVMNTTPHTAGQFRLPSKAEFGERSKRLAWLLLIFTEILQPRDLRAQRSGR
jgi:hypothetical protein